MALEGRLSEFTLEEILQLIALQQKTGVLTVEASYPMVLYFESGELVSYRDRRGSSPDPLKTYLRSSDRRAGSTSTSSSRTARSTWPRSW